MAETETTTRGFLLRWHFLPTWNTVRLFRRHGFPSASEKHEQGLDMNVGGVREAKGPLFSERVRTFSLLIPSTNLLTVAYFL